VTTRTYGDVSDPFGFDRLESQLREMRRSLGFDEPGAVHADRPEPEPAPEPAAGSDDGPVVDDGGEAAEVLLDESAIDVDLDVDLDDHGALVPEAPRPVAADEAPSAVVAARARRSHPRRPAPWDLAGLAVAWSGLFTLVALALAA
jgi:hypothetical protein